MPTTTASLYYPKRVFRLIYFGLMIFAIINIGSVLIGGLYGNDGGGDLVNAVVGPDNKDAVKIFVTLFIVCSLSYLIVAYFIFECFEERVGPFDPESMAATNSGIPSIFRFVDFLARFAIAGLIILGVEHFDLNSYADTAQFLFFVTLSITVWLCLLYASYKILRPWDILISALIALASYLISMLASTGQSEGNYGVIILFLIFVAVGVIGGYVLYWIGTEGKKSVAPLLRYYLPPY